MMVIAVRICIGEPLHTQHAWPFALGLRSINLTSPDILRFTGQDMLCELKEKTHHRKGFGFSQEELVVGSVGEHCDLSVLLDAYYL